MGSIFRITKAEFIKAFKRPTIYVMAFILLITAVISALIFNPQKRADDRLNYSGTTGVEVYNSFNSSGAGSKSSIDAEVSFSSTKVMYFTNMEKRANTITEKYNNILNTYAQLLKDQKTVDEYKAAVAEYKDAINDKYGLNTIEFVNTAYSLPLYYDETDETYKSFSQYLDEYIAACVDKTTIITGYTNATTEYKLTQYDRFRNVTNQSIDFIHGTINYYINQAKIGWNVLYKLNFRNQWQNTASQKIIQNDALDTISTNLEKLHLFVNQLYSKNYNVIYMSKDNYQEFETTKTYIINQLVNKARSESDWAKRLPLLKEVATNSFIENLYTINSKISLVSPSSQSIKDLNSASNKTTENLSNIFSKMESEKTTSSADQMKEYASDYYMLANSYNDYVNDTIMLSTTSKMSLSEIKNIKGDGYEKYNHYETKERQALNLYKINNGISGQNNLNALSFNTNSGYETNGYDYMFYTLSIMAVLIVIFSIMMTAITIGSEQDSGTIKLLLVRPFTRTQILISKLLSVFFFIITFVIFSFVIALIAGLTVYGLPATHVLAVFNANVVMNIHPIVLILLQLVTMIFQISFYVSFAFAIAVVIKNFAAVLVSSLIVYLGGVTCNILLSSSLAFKWIPFTNSYLFRYFGGAFASKTSDLTNIFVSPIYSSMGFVWSIIICLIVMTILNTISLLVFRNRDF